MLKIRFQKPSKNTDSFKTYDIVAIDSRKKRDSESFKTHLGTFSYTSSGRKKLIIDKKNVLKHLSEGAQLSRGASRLLLPFLKSIKL